MADSPSLASAATRLYSETAGYHLRDIPKGKIGEFSKIREEMAELEDAHEQGIAIMVLCELSDLIGAIDAFLDVQFPHQSLQDLIDMSEVTKRAFRNGRRK